MKRPAALMALILAAVAACSAEEPVASPTQAPTQAATTAPPPSPAQSETPTGPPAFTSKVSAVKRDDVPYSWRPGCPVPLSGLRLVTLTYWGFDDKAHTGELVVNKSVTDDIVTVFKQLYGWKWPIERMELVDVFKGDDFDSIDANNTSAFNCRAATGSSNWSKHAYGLAIDINPQQNPYVTAGGSVAHDNAEEFKTRPLDEPGVINGRDRVVRAFEKVGWEWGGYWSGTKDYQHFSKGGG